MAIPGRKLDKVETRAKVRVGIKAPTSSGRLAPKSIDWFVSDDEEFGRFCGSQPKTLRITLPYATADECFSTGLEWWKGKMLACYTHDGGSDPTALRMAGDGSLNLLDADDELRGQKVGNNRQPIACRADACPHFGKNADNKECRPMGRLQFFLEGGRTDQALQLDTKGWDSIKGIAGTLASTARSGDLRDHVFELTVHMETKGRDRWPVVTIRRADVQINSEADAGKADALVIIESGLAAGKPHREILAEALDHQLPGWRDREDVVARIKEQGAQTALATMHARLLTEAKP